MNAEEHIALDGTSLSDEQRFEAELQHVEDSIKSEVAGLGEILLQLSGSRSVVSGDLSPEQHAVLVERIKATANEVWRTHAVRSEKAMYSEACR